MKTKNKKISKKTFTFLENSSRNQLLFLSGVIVAFFLFVIFPGFKEIKQVEDTFNQIQKNLIMYQQISERLAGSQIKPIYHHTSLVEYLEKGAKKLGVDEKITMIHPQKNGVEIEMREISLPELFALFSPIEEVPPIGTISFLKLIPEDDSAQHFHVQARLMEH